ISLTEETKNYVTAPFEARFPNTNQAQNCFQNHLDLTRLCQTKGQDVAPSEWYQRVYKSLCPLSWVLLIEKCQEYRYTYSTSGTNIYGSLFAI
uniref:Uncharacterized protein n=1 Tax=Oncorhynchus mykiss TaxID=8022 RepID=A0A8C7UU46_ONCMY